MVIVRGMYEIAEVVAASILCVCCYLSGYNILPLKDAADLSTLLFILSVVFLLNHARVQLLAPVEQSWRLCLELGCFYLCTQFAVLCVWDPFHSQLHVLRDFITNTRPVLNLLGSYPKVFVFIRQDCWYILKLITAIAITYMTVHFTHALDYVLPGRRRYQYTDRVAPDQIFDEFWRRPRLLSRRRIISKPKPKSIREELNKSLIDY
ncbi:hypothetical protein KR074_012528 [Drosophila pseudoananassae]|nr:hypothetical protein KR074_012528 [Drosophila pseudoananassae]